MRFAHIADVHLGYKQYNLDERYNDFADIWLRTCGEIIKARVKLVLIAGDLFHHRIIDPQTLQIAKCGLEKFSQSGIMVYAVEGNHEQPRNPNDGSWLQYLQNDGLLIVLDSRDKDLPFHYQDGLRIGGIPWSGAATDEVLSELDFVDDSLFNILVVHGSYKWNQVGSFTIIPKYVDYVACGHKHIHAEDMRTGVYTPGALEICSVQEPQGGALIIDTHKHGRFELVDYIQLPIREQRTVHLNTEGETIIKVNDGSVLHVYKYKPEQTYTISGNPLYVVVHKKYAPEIMLSTKKIDVESEILRELPLPTINILQMAINKDTPEKIYAELSRID